MVQCDLVPFLRAEKANIPTLGHRFLVKFPWVGKAIEVKCPTFVRVPPPPLGLNIDRCIIVMPNLNMKGHIILKPPTPLHVYTDVIKPGASMESRYFRTGQNKYFKNILLSCPKMPRLHARSRLNLNLHLTPSNTGFFRMSLHGENGKWSRPVTSELFIRLKHNLPH